MDLPDNNTIKILEDRKNFLKNKKNNAENSFILAEIGALDRTINLIKLFQNNLPDDILKKIITGNENNNVKEIKDKDYEILYSFDKEITENLKLDISFIQYKGEKQIIIVLKKFKREFLKWAYQGRIRTTVETLEEIIKKSNEIWKIKKTNDK
jgi:hypothetical protein